MWNVAPFLNVNYNHILSFALSVFLQRASEQLQPRLKVEKFPIFFDTQEKFSNKFVF